ncbi:MAG: hypothetical protein ACI85I_000859 [Arenicella sp.]|jgi:hypothetical protein
MKYTQYIGILLGGLYGLTYRTLCESPKSTELFDFNIYSISFIWILPIAIGVIPLLFATKEIVKSRTKQFFFPILSVFIFFIFALSIGLEDWLCILIIAIPFLLVAGIAGLVLGSFMKKHKAENLYSILFLPFLLSPLESQFPNSKEQFHVQNEIIINSGKSEVWNILIEVPEISDDEYEMGFLNYIGIPRPIKSKLEYVNGKQYRVGYFTDDLKLFESISKLDSTNFVSFDIHIDKSELRDLPTDKHLLGSNYFQFQNISYELVSLDNHVTKLILSCDYTIESKMNGYAGFWANVIV